MKVIIIQDALIVYPKHGEPFDIHTDASDYQIGGVVSQNNKPIAYFLRKFNTAQMKYTVTAKKLLVIVETLNFRSMLLGQVIKIWTDHKNLTYDNTDFSSDRILHQRLIIEEFGATTNFFSVVNNETADALSRLDTRSNEFTNFQECFLKKKSICFRRDLSSTILYDRERTKKIRNLKIKAK